jgi:hypothetical protein
MNVAAAYLALGGVVTIGFGVVYLGRSGAMARMVEIELPSAPARADYRSIYGGSQIGVGLFFCFAAWQASWRPAGLAALGLFVLGFGVTRLASLAYDRVRRDPQWVIGGLEIVAGILAALLLARNGG